MRTGCLVRRPGRARRSRPRSARSPGRTGPAARPRRASSRSARSGSSQHLAGQPGGAPPGVVGVPLDLARPRGRGRRACRRDARSSSRSPSSTGSPGRCSGCGSGTRCSRRRRGRRTARSTSSAARAAGSSSRTVARSPVQRSYSSSTMRNSGVRVGRPVVRRVRPLAGSASARRGAARAGSCPAPRPGSRRTRWPAGGQRPQRGPAQLRDERQRLVAGDQAVPAEQGHEPRQPGRRQRRSGTRVGVAAAARPGRPGCAGRSGAGRASRCPPWARRPSQSSSVPACSARCDPLRRRVARSVADRRPRSRSARSRRGCRSTRKVSDSSVKNAPRRWMLVSRRKSLALVAERHAARARRGGTARRPWPARP